jgi:hypothetical protein
MSINRRKLFSFLAASPVAAVGAAQAVSTVPQNSLEFSNGFSIEAVGDSLEIKHGGRSFMSLQNQHEDYIAVDYHTSLKDIIVP